MLIMQNYTLESNKTLSDISVNLSKKYTTIISQTGSGKTYWAIHTLPLLFPDKRIILLVPFQSIAKQKSEAYSIHGVYAGSRANQDTLQIAVYDCLNQFDDLSNTILVVDEYHHLTLSQNYRQPALEHLLERSEEAFKTIFLTGTKVSSYHPIFRLESEEVYVTSEKDQSINYIAVKPKHILQSIHNRLKSDMLNVVYLNRVQTIIVYAKYLEECGYKTFIMSSENKNSDEFLKVLNTKRFPEDVNVILTTAVFSEGIDIEDEREINLMMVSHEDPAFIRQVVGRFRSKKPSSFYVFYRKDPSIDHAYCDADKLYERLQKEAELLSSSLNIVTKAFKSQKEALKELRMNLLFDKQLLVKEREEYEIAYSGISYLIRKKQVSIYFRNEKSLKREMGKYKMYLVNIEEDTEDLELPSLLKELKQEEKENTTTQQLQSLIPNVNPPAKVTKTFIEKCNTIKETVSNYFTEEKVQEILTRVVQAANGSAQKLNTFMKQLTCEVQLKLGQSDPMITSLYHALKQKTRQTSKEIHQIVQRIYSEFNMYDWVKVTERQSVSILKMLFKIRRTSELRGKETVNCYEIVNDNPLSLIGVEI